MFKLLAILTPLLAPALAASIGASRRNRLRRRVTNYVKLANDLEAGDPASAKRIRGVVSETVEQLADLERRALHRRIDPWAIVTLLFLTVPSIAVAVWAWTWNSGWRWLVIVIAVLWTLIWGGVGLSQVITHEPKETPDGTETKDD